MLGNQIKEQGAKRVASALRTNSTLEVLTLQGNRIGNLGAKAIADSVKGKSALKEVNLSRKFIHHTLYPFERNLRTESCISRRLF